MGKIKNQTPEQKEIHNRAVKIKKMIDEKLVERYPNVLYTHMSNMYASQFLGGVK